MESTKPYLIRAIYDWCVDVGYTPYIIADVNHTVTVPRTNVKSNEIVLNIAPSSVAKLVISNELITFSARFSGVNEAVIVPIESIKSIYAAENNEGLHFKVKQNLSTNKNDIKELSRANKLKKSHLKLVK